MGGARRADALRQRLGAVGARRCRAAEWAALRAPRRPTAPPRVGDRGARSGARHPPAPAPPFRRRQLGLGSPGRANRRRRVPRAGGGPRDGRGDRVVAGPDPDEVERVEWIPVDDVRTLLRDGSISDGLSLVALYRALEE